jgi:hypothetical protein
MTFIECCELIADVKENYKVIYPSFLSRQQFSFKFERLGKQYDAFDIIYEHYANVLNILPTHDKTNLSSRVEALGVSILDFGALCAMSSGAWKKDMPISLKEFYEQRRIEFEGITGIKVS